MAYLSPSNFKSDIDSRVNQNGLRAITGLIMNSVLTNIKDSLTFRFIEPDTAGRDSIPAPDRYKGMLVFVESSDTIFKLKNDLTTWEKLPDDTSVQALIDSSIADIKSAILAPAGSLTVLRNINTTSEQDYPNYIHIYVEGIGIFYLDRDSIEVDNNNTIIEPNTGVGAWKRTSLKNSEMDYLVDLIASGFSASLIERELSQRTVTISQDLNISDKFVLVDASSGVISLTMPDPTLVTGFEYIIKRIDSTANTISIQPFDTDLIEFESILFLEIKGESATLRSNGTDWFLT